eukprot:15179428-Alexandrium_andersonii.AAC.1
MEPRGAPDPSGGPLGSAGRARAFGRRSASSDPTRRSGRAGAPAQGAGSSGPKGCERHAGDAGGAWVHGELPEAPPHPQRPSGGWRAPLGGAPGAVRDDSPREQRPRRDPCRPARERALGRSGA